MVLPSLLVLCTGDTNDCTAVGGQCVSAPGLGAGTCAKSSYSCPVDPTWGNATCLFPLSTQCKTGTASLNGCAAGYCEVTQPTTDGASPGAEGGAEAPPCTQFACCTPCADAGGD
jgi:hypothetical protein